MLEKKGHNNEAKLQLIFVGKCAVKFNVYLHIISLCWFIKWITNSTEINDISHDKHNA